MTEERTIDTGGGTYVEGNFNRFDYRTQVTQVTIQVLPGADTDVIRVFGASLREVAATQPSNPYSARDAKVTGAPGVAQNGPGNDLPFDLGPHWIVCKPAIFENQQWFVMGSVLLIPTLAGRETRLRTFGGSDFYEFDVRLTPDGQLEARIWESSEAFVRIASSPNEQTFTTTSAAHRWRFQQFDPTQVLPVGGSQSSAVSFDPSLVQTIWRIRHERETKRPHTFLLALKQATQEANSNS